MLYEMLPFEGQGMHMLNFLLFAQKWSSSNLLQWQAIMAMCCEKYWILISHQSIGIPRLRQEYVYPDTQVPLFWTLSLNITSFWFYFHILLIGQQLCRIGHFLTNPYKLCHHKYCILKERHITTGEDEMIIFVAIIILFILKPGLNSFFAFFCFVFLSNILVSLSCFPHDGTLI